MLPALVSTPAVETPAVLLADYAAHLAATGRGNIAYERAARAFMARWPAVQTWAGLPLRRQLAVCAQTRPFLTFLMVSGRLHPSYDYLVARKLSSLWRELTASPLEPDLRRFIDAAGELGFSERQASAVASQIIARLLIHTGHRLDELTGADLVELVAACRDREKRTGRGWRHYQGALHTARQVLFHLGVLERPAPPAVTRAPFAARMAGVPEPLHGLFVAYLHRKSATCVAGTVSGLATRLAHFGGFLAEIDPQLGGLSALDRRRHIEPYLAALTDTTNTKTGGVLSVAERARRVLAVANFLTEISEWGWPEAPARQLLFRSDTPRLPRPLPRYLPVDADRRLSAELTCSPHRLAADALLLQRACGLRIGELLDLELDCVHEVPAQGWWLKVPLGKLDTERMVPLDEETLAILDRISDIRSPGRPIPHPRTGKPAEFLFTHHGRRLSQNAVRAELSRAADTAGLGHLTPHQLRHTYATALVNAGVSLQALMALLGHVSAQMSLRYGRLFDATVRDEYERALALAKSHLGPLPAGRPGLPLADITGGTDWRDAPAFKARLAGGYCLRAPAQGACPYANICEHCPNFHTDATHLQILSAQRVDAEALAHDAAERGWITEAARHRDLVTRLDTLIAHTHAG
ncbi:MAG: tyrosine-type recombinase/integrase [Frankia sp.]